MPQLHPPTPRRDRHQAWLGRWFTGIRRAGFLTTFGAEDWHTLCALLSFTSQAGRCVFTVDQLGTVLGLPRESAATRLERLARVRWHGEPVVTPSTDETGAVTGVTLADLAPLAVGTAIPLGETSHPLLPPTLLESLRQVGLNSVQIDSLARRFPETEIRRQLGWLPARGARNPAALLIRAIEQGWDEPKEGV